MKRKRLIIAICSVATVVGVLMCICLRPRAEPSWNGKNCSQWFAEFRQAKIRCRRMFISRAILPAGSTGQTPVTFTNYIDDIDALLSDSSADALRHLGTNTLPILTAEIRRGDPIWQPLYAKTFHKLPLSIRRVVPNPPVIRDEVRADAALALTVLRSDAAPAWPVIFEAFATASPFARYQFEESLRKIPVEPAVFDAAIGSLVSRGDLSLAVSVIGQFGAWRPNSMRVLTNAIVSTNVVAGEAALSQLRYNRRFASYVLPALRTAITNGNQGLCLSVVNVLESYGEDASDALPELVQTLKSSDSELRYRAARAIENLGTNALAAGPSLVAAKSDPNEMVQRVVTRTLENLNYITNYQAEVTVRHE